MNSSYSTGLSPHTVVRLRWSAGVEELQAGGCTTGGGRANVYTNEAGRRGRELSQGAAGSCPESDSRCGYPVQVLSLASSHLLQIQKKEWGSIACQGVSQGSE